MSRGLEWLDSLQTRGIRPGLENIRCLTNGLDNPQNSYRTIHVAGSDGKGSVCCFLESILKEAGLKVGMFTSPQILRINECIRIDGNDIDDDTLDKFLLDVKSVAERDSIECTNFEAHTACAFHAFRQAKVDIAIVEVGMGGRLDSTNIIVPEVTVINNIELEHKVFLGNTLEEIASEKAGIMKKGVPCVTMNSGPVLDVIKAKSEQLGCPLTVVDPDDIEVKKNCSDHLDFNYKGIGYTSGLPGRFQSKNASIALEVVNVLKDSNNIETYVKKGLSKACWHYRMEKLSDLPLVIDVTHTRKGAEYLADDISEIYGKVTLVTGMLNDKDLDGVAQALSRIASKVYVSAPDSPRAATSDNLAASYSKFHDDVTVCDTLGHALEQALKNDGIVLVTGSFRTAEDCLRWLKRM